MEANDLYVFNSFVNKKLTSRPRGIPPLVVDQETVCDPTEKSEVFNNFFQSVFVRDNNVVPTIQTKVAPNISISNVNFTPHIVRKHLQKLRPNTSSGPDGVPPILLKKLANQLCLSLSHIFNVSFTQSALPKIWLQANVIPIYKNKGPTSSAKATAP